MFFQLYLLQVIYTIFQYLTVSCIPATGHVYDISIPVYISRYDTGDLLIVADILQHVPSEIPDIDCSWHFMASYLLLFFLAEIVWS